MGLNKTGSIVLFILLMLLFTYFIFQAKNRKIEAFFLMIVPTLDIQSDFIYLSSEMFYDVSYFYCSLIFYLIPNIAFIYELYRIKSILPTSFIFPGYIYISPNILWLSMVILHIIMKKY